MVTVTPHTPMVPATARLMPEEEEPGLEPALGDREGGVVVDTGTGTGTVVSLVSSVVWVVL